MLRDVGMYSAGLTVFDDGGQTSSDSVSVTVDNTVPEPGTVTVVSITYSTEGGRDQDKHLNIVVSLEDGDGNPVSGASVSIELDLDGTFDSSGTATTGSDGTVTFSRKNAPAGTWTTEVTGVTASGNTWDGTTPANSLTK